MGNRAIAMMAAERALDNIGVQETGNNRGKYIRKYQLICSPPAPEGSPWCAAFMVYRYVTAASELGEDIPDSFPRSAWCPDFARWAKKEGLYIPQVSAREDTSLVREGDIALFYFKALGRIAHCGIVTEVLPLGVWTVEGNTSPEPEDVDLVERDGDGVYRKFRNWSELGKYGGFVRIDF